MFKLNNNNNVIFLFVFLLSAVIILSKIFRSTDSNEDKEILKVIFFFNFLKFINARIYINIIFNKKRVSATERLATYTYRSIFIKTY